MNKVSDLFAFLTFVLSIICAKGLAVDICENHPDGTRLAHPVDCTKFVICRQSQTDRILTCPLGLHFNRVDSICDMRDRAACGSKLVKRAFKNLSVDTPTPGVEDYVSISGNNTGNISDRAGPSTGPSGTTCFNSGKCIGQPDGKMFADPNNTGYIVCQCECQIEMPCAPGTKFDESLDTCNHINAGGSGGDGGANSTNCTNPGKCADQPNGTIFPNPNTNTGYLQCQNDCEVKKSCAPGTIFNETLASCVNASDVSGDFCKTSGIKCTNPGKCAGKSDGTILPATNATSFIVCLCECERIRSCAPDTIFQESLNVCVHVKGNGDSCDTSDIKCNNPGQCASQPDGTIFANPNTTTGFIECKCECQFEKPCVPGTIFNEALKFCVHVNGGSGFNGADNSGGTSCSGGEEASGSGDGTGSKGSNASGGSCGSGSSEGSVNTDGTASECDMGKVKCNNPGKCVNQPDGAIFANPNTTTGYIECRCGCELEKPCVHGTIFNEPLKFCVHVNGGGAFNGTDNTGETSCPGGEVTCGKGSTSGSEASGGSCGSDNSEGKEGCINKGDSSNCGAGKVRCNNPGKCVNQPDGTIFANPNTTTGYIECRCECELEKPCVHGTIFNEPLKFCVHVNGGGTFNGTDNTGETSFPGGEVTCGSEGGTGSKGSTSGSEVSGGSCGSVNSEGAVGCVKEGASGGGCAAGKVRCNNPGKCVNQPDGTIFANPNITTGYIECRCECELEKPCVPGTIFNEPLKFCVHVIGGGGDNDSLSSTAGEGGCGGTTGNGEGDGFGNKCGSGGKDGGGASGDTGGSEGQDGSVIGGEEGGDDTGGENGSSGTETGGETSGCGVCKTPGKCIDKPDGTIFTNLNSTGYIICICKCPIESFCAIGTIFNETLKTCIYKDCEGLDNGVSGSGCNKGGGSDNTSISGATDGESNIGSDSVNGVTETGNSKTVTGGNSKAGIDGPSTGPSGTTCADSGKCAQQKDGTMFHDPNSAGYIVCQCECEIKMPCAPGTAFSDILKTCDHIKSK